MFKRQKTGSVVCRSCGRLVGVNDERCFECGAWNPGLWGFAPLVRRLGNDLGFVPLVIWGCSGLFLATLLYDPAGIRMQGGLSILSPSSTSLLVFGGSGAFPVFRLGHWWTLLSAAWLHGGLLHLLFNMMWVRQLAPATAEIYGAARMVIIYTVSSVTGFFLSSWAGAFLPFLGGAFFTIGASAPIFGLLGALVYSGRRGGSSAIGRQALVFAVILGVFGFVMPGVDNWAHAGGFAGGYGTGRLLDPFKPERLNHLIAALACILLTAGSLVLSVAVGLSLQ